MDWLLGFALIAVGYAAGRLSQLARMKVLRDELDYQRRHASLHYHRARDLQAELDRIDPPSGHRNIGEWGSLGDPW